MLLRLISAPLTDIKGINNAHLPKFKRLGITDISGLLSYYPREWEDRSVKVTIREYQKGQVCTVVTVKAHEWRFFGKKRVLKIYVEDESGIASLFCYNRPWMEKHLVKGSRYRLFGRFYYKYGEIQSGSFEAEQFREQETSCPVMPVYPLCAGITQNLLRNSLNRAIEQYAGRLENELPEEIISRDNLLPKSTAIRAIHFPLSVAELEQAKKTLIYEELFYLEIMVGKRALERKQGSGGREKLGIRNEELGIRNKATSLLTPHSSLSKSPIPDPRSLIPDPFSPLQQRLIDRLPFKLTPGQTNAIAEINSDMVPPDMVSATLGGAGTVFDTTFSMARLLQGDVGSGKTLVSFLAALRAADIGGQTALMAPTELLARQHAENAAILLEPLGLRIAFLTGNIKTQGRKELLRNLESGEIDLVVGTHALFSKDVNYKNLKLVVVDEQHRFGVTQRSTIMAKGNSPHLLMMSATPIPRTLALTVFGDMDVSVISDMPPGRKPVKTHLTRLSNSGNAYNFVRKKLDSGSQAYFVYPLIETSDKSDLKDAVSMSEKLAKEVFPNHSVALIHSKLSEDEKKETMDLFRKGEIKVLAATSVVEVGVDVPNANCIVIEHAERFGLSALHQLRGRVGRGKDQAFCFLIYSDDLTEEGKSRLKAMWETSDGFVIAEEDLKLRGPGQISGIEQSGFFNLGIANPIRDIEALTRARSDAFFILENDSGLILEGHRTIARVLQEAPPFSEVVF